MAAENVPFVGDANSGWTLTIDNTKPKPFNFLKNLMNDNKKYYLLISYLAKS